VTEDERAKLAYIRAELGRMYAQAIEADRCDRYELRWAALALLACVFITRNAPEYRWAVDALLVAVGFRVGRVLANVESAIRRWWRSRV
jgi:hypothetical protein